MATKQEIANGVMRLLGQQTFTLSDGTPHDAQFGDLYDEVLADLLRSHPWNFATKREELTQNGTAPIFEFEFAYDLPADFIRIISVHPNSDGRGTIVYREELVDDTGDTRVLVAGANELWLRYVALITDTTLFPPDFTRALQYALARDLSIPITDSNTLEDTFGKKADRWLAKARSADGLGQYPERRPRGSWVEVRGRALPVVGE